MSSVEHEDNLLNTRTGIFLGVNTLLMAVVGKEGIKIPFIVEVLGLLITLLWLWVAIVNRQAILKARGMHTFGKLYRPTDILAIWLPILVIIFWVCMSVYPLIGII